MGEDAVDDVGVVVDAELIGHGKQERVGGCDRLVLLELLDQHIRLGGVGAAEDRLGLRVDEPDLVGVLVLAAEVRPVPVIDEGEDAPADRYSRLPLVASLLPCVAERLDRRTSGLPNSGCCALACLFAGLHVANSGAIVNPVVPFDRGPS